MKEKHANHLIKETSPYLLQHAFNPVNWHPWGKEALEKSKREDKPILVSIGYSACHWCHVMERESFEDEETAALMNRFFVNIKIDREERPDLDHIYMDAVQAITGSGGWPLNVFLTPDLKPFYGGTYFPPVRAFNRSSWKEVITAVASAYKEKKEEITQQAEYLTDHLIKANNFQAADMQARESASGKASLQKITESLLKTADKEWGGFGNTPKFPQAFSILFLLRHYHFSAYQPALDQALLSLDKMMMGGIYDQLGGGFARYATDRRWQIPHFEKMLYDNALLLDAFTEAYQLTGKSEYADVVRNTVQFLENEMMFAEGGFYSALDADSEGEEGKYYTWTFEEINNLLGAEAKIFCSVFDVLENGNWEHKSILWMPQGLQNFPELNEAEAIGRLQKSKQILLEEREKRVHPGLDDKIILGWNALIIKSLCKAYAAIGEKEYLNLAEKTIFFLEKNLGKENFTFFYHSWNKIINEQEAFLDDYAALTQAYIFLHQVTANTDYLLKARTLTEKLLENFSGEGTVLFDFTNKDQTDVIIRKREIYDGATPSGNALMAENLNNLSILFDVPAWRERAEKMVELIMTIAEKYPTSFGYWCMDLQALTLGMKEIAILGANYDQIATEILSEYIPLKLLQSAPNETDAWPLLTGKSFSQDKTMIYVCENYKCLQPVETVGELRNIIAKNIFNKKSIGIK